MKNITKTIGILFFSILLLNCNGDYTGQELKEWILNKDNGLIKSIENENFIIEVQYKPTEYMVAIENKETTLTQEELDVKKKEKEGLQYFNIKLISKTGKDVFKTALKEQNEEAFRLNYYLKRFEYNIFLADGQDTLPCVIYHFENSYGGIPENNISIAFQNKNKNKEGKKLVFLDEALGFNHQEFEFKKEDLQNIPHLKTK